VGYHVRYDSSTCGPATRLKFATDGVLLREIASDLLLRQYSCVVLDEAHERNVNTDILLGLLSRAVTLRNALARQDARDAVAAAGDGPAPEPSAASPLPLGPLKLVIMSATLRVDDFASNPRLFPRPLDCPPAPGSPWPPVLSIQARQFPVSPHFARVTDTVDYVGQAVAKAIKIHTRLPPGGILIFLTGSQEVEDAVRRLRDRFDPAKRKQRKAAQPQPPSLPVGSGGAAAGGVAGSPLPVDAAADEPASAAAVATAPAAAASGVGGELEAEAEADALPPVHVLPLYALLPAGAQQRVFAPAPTPEHRLIIVSTNVAETSLTIPGIR